MFRKKVKMSVGKMLFKKAANRTHVKNLSFKHYMMRGGYHL